VSEAENWAQQAVNIAQQKQLGNLQASALLELGNAFSGKDESKAESYFTQALQVAKANKGRLREGMALTNLGSLYLRTLRIDDGLRHAEQALTIFQQDNYPRQAVDCLSHIGRGRRRKGDYAAAQQAFNQKLELAKQIKSQKAIADSYADIGSLLLDQERFPEALEQYGKAIEFYGAKNAVLIAFCNTNRAQILMRLGRYDEAKHVLDELFNLTKSNNDLLGLVPELNLIQAQMSLDKGDLGPASASATEAIKAAGPKSEATIQAQYLLALAKGGSAEAQNLCKQSMEAASTAGDFGLHSRVLLACADVALKAKDPKTALALATQAQGRFARGGSQIESEWHAWAIAARASKDLGDNNTAQEQISNAEGARSRLEQLWGADVFKQYAAVRPDIQVYYR